MDTESPKREPSVDDLRDSMMDVLEIHKQMMTRLIEGDRDFSGLAELFEDVGNRYLDFSAELARHQPRLNMRRMA